MQIHNLQASHAIAPPSRAASSGPAGHTGRASQTGAVATDELELSPEALRISQVQSTEGVLGSSTGIRTDRVAELRQAIAAGNYETPERLSAALDKLLDTFA